MDGTSDTPGSSDRHGEPAWKMPPAPPLAPPPPSLSASASAPSGSPAPGSVPPRSAWWKRSVPLWALLLSAVVGIGVGAVAGGGDSEQSDETVVAADGEQAARSTDNDATTTTDTRPTTTRATTTTERVTTTTTPPYEPQAADFQIGIVETERSCFGSAGCNITYRIDVTYVGVQPLDSSASYTVVYEVHGGDDLQTKNFEIRGSEIEYSEELISTPPNPNLSAVAVRVLDN